MINNQIHTSESQLQQRCADLEKDNARLRHEIWTAIETLRNDLYSKRVGNTLSILDEALRLQ